MEAVVAPEVADVVDAARGEVVEDEHLVAAGQVGLGEVGADETRAARDQDSHDVRGLSIAWEPGRREPRRDGDTEKVETTIRAGPSQN